MYLIVWARTSPILTARKFLFVRITAQSADAEPLKLSRISIEVVTNITRSGDISFVIECPGLPINLRNGAEEYIERMADDIDHCRHVEPFSSNVIEHIKRRRARGVKYDSDEDVKDAEKMPHEFDYSSAEEEAANSASEGNQDNYVTPLRKKRRFDE